MQDTRHFKIDISDKQIVLTPQKHDFTLIWIHGLNENPAMHLRYLLNQPIIQELTHFRIVIPQAPTRHVTVSNHDGPSWFDIKFRNEKSFVVDFNEAFSAEQVEDSYQKYLKPVIEREHGIVHKAARKIFVGGFSQGCGMALHCLYSTPDVEFAGIIGVSGYLFPITPFKKQIQTPKVIIYGLADPLRPWDFVKVTYKDKFEEKDFVLVGGMEHEVKKKETMTAVAKFLRETTEGLKKK